ncbi:MAG: ABC transporter ATP-binding protein, partial [Armatimonadota bacterium]|nr:ABC transporter ATP-binding protein [Armatimonadota bacterium]
APGELVGIIGPNGSGKSSLIRSISRVLRPRAGRVLLEGRDVYAEPARWVAQRMAVVPQDTRVEFGFTALEIVLMGRMPHLGRFSPEGPRDLELARQAMERTGTLQLAQRSILSLSGGERQRVMVARALAQQARVVLLDEPTAHLDLNFQVEILRLVDSLRREGGRAVLVVLHDLNLAAQFCDRLLLLHRARVEAEGTPEAVLTAETLRRVYGAEVLIRRHPETGRPYVVARAGRGAPQLAEASENPLVHVICGAGTGEPVFEALLERGLRVTAGVVNVGDSDQAAAERLNLRYVDEAPFTAISDDTHAAHLRFIRDADVVLLTDFPLGPANLRNLEAAESALQWGKPVFLLKAESVATRDYSGGRASQVYARLLEAGAVPLPGVDALPLPRRGGEG